MTSAERPSDRPVDGPPPDEPGPPPPAEPAGTPEPVVVPVRSEAAFFSMLAGIPLTAICLAFGHRDRLIMGAIVWAGLTALNLVYNLTH